MTPDPLSGDQVTALNDGALLVPLRETARLRLEGADRVDFLHGQVSNEVRGLPPGGANRSLLLNHKGHVLAEMQVLRSADSIDVLVEGGARAVVEESFRRHIVFDQVELKAAPDAEAAMTLQGPRASQVLTRAVGRALPEVGSFSKFDFASESLILVPRRRSAAGGFDLLASGSGLSELERMLIDAGAVAGGTEALSLALVAAGIASAPSEGGEGILPQEAGLEDAVSYRKGCYLGQEIMARIEARGKVRRGLVGLALGGQPAHGEMQIESDGKVVGKLGRVGAHPELGLVALAVLRSDVAADASLEVGGVSAHTLALPIALPR